MGVINANDARQFKRGVGIRIADTPLFKVSVLNALYAVRAMGRLNMMPPFHRLAARPFFSTKQKPSSFRAGCIFAGALAVSLTAGAANAANGFESVFDCGDVIGKVFDDQNRNGYQDAGEVGLPGVRLASVQGLQSVTDKFGRYHITCADLPRTGIGSIFLMKLDPRTLPAGYRISTENPRAVRLTAGKTTKLNFGASLSRMVRLDLAGAAFEANGTGLNAEWEAGIDQLIGILDQDHAVLRLVYDKGAEDKTLADERMRAVSRLVEERWQRQDRSYPLEIERRVMTGR